MLNTSENWLRVVSPKYATAKVVFSTFALSSSHATLVEGGEVFLRYHSTISDSVRPPVYVYLDPYLYVSEGLDYPSLLISYN